MFGQLVKKYRELLSYGFWGLMTTFVNYIIFFLCLRLFHINYLISNVISWVVAVTFAYLTNKFFVFAFTGGQLSQLCREVIQFFSGRLFSLAVESLLLFLLVDGMNLKSDMMKIFTNLVVIVINYFIAKLIIFRKGNTHG